MLKMIKNSAMRLSLIWGLSIISLLILGLTYRLVTDEVPDYSGASLVIAGCSGFIGVLVTGKAYQKITEEKYKENGKIEE